MNVIEQLLRLLADSEYHKKYTPADICSFILPAIREDKIYYMFDGPHLTGFATYAFLSEEAAKGYAEGTRRIQPQDFEGQEGELWFIDFATPYGGCRDFSRYLRKEFTNKYGPDATAKINRTSRKHIGLLYAEK